MKHAAGLLDRRASRAAVSDSATMACMALALPDGVEAAKKKPGEAHCSSSVGIDLAVFIAREARKEAICG